MQNKATNTTAHLLKWPNFVTSATLKGYGATRSSHSLLVGMQYHTAILKDSFVVSYKIKHTFTIKSSNHIPWYLPKGAESL